MEFIRISFAIIEDYVLASIVINTVLAAEIRFYVSNDGDGVYQKEDDFVYCSDMDMQVHILLRANEYAKQHNLIKDFHEK